MMEPARKYIVTFCPACRHPHPGVTQTYLYTLLEDDSDERFHCSLGGRMVPVRAEGVIAELAPESA